MDHSQDINEILSKDLQGLNHNQMISQQQTQEQLLVEIKELKASIKKLETDIEDIKFFTPQPKTIIDKETIGTIGGLILGALVIIGIFF